MCVCMSACMHVCLHMRVCMCVFMYVYICIVAHVVKHTVCITILLHVAVVNSLAPVSQPAPSDASLLVDVLGGTDISSQPFGGSNNNDSFDVDPEVNKGMKK